MQPVIIDFETYYDREYSLSKMSTEEYVNDPRFEIIMVGVKFGDQPTKVYTGSLKKLKATFDHIKLWDQFLIAHNMHFDGLILAVHFGKLPKFLGCTRAMAQAALSPTQRSISLAKCMASYPDAPQKLDTVHNMMGRSKGSLNRTEMKAYAEYCGRDCDAEWFLFKKLLPEFPKHELRIIDRTLRMYLEPPKIKVDPNIMAEVIQEVEVKLATAIMQLPGGLTAKDMSSNPKFAKALRDHGVMPPMKISPITGQPTYAFAKSDPGFQDMLDEYEDHPDIGPMLAARVGTKSTIAVSRAQRLLNIAKHYGGLRIPLLYYKAHTGRYGGAEKINPQNFPGVRKSRMRFGLKAPEGHSFIAADLSQVEARITAYLAGETRLLKLFAEGGDPYVDFAQIAFRREVVKGRSKEDDRLRFIGKTCILGLGYGMSGHTLQNTLRSGGMKLDIMACETLVNVYRNTYTKIPALWKRMDKILSVHGRGDTLVRLYLEQFPVEGLLFQKNRITLPGGMWVRYPELSFDMGERQWFYTFGGMRRTIWGGKMTENVVQALARTVIMENMLKISDGLNANPVLQQHDELDYVEPDDQVDTLVEGMYEIMRKPPAWAPRLPLDAEINVGKTLGDCK